MCTCLPEYQGDPYRECRPECVLNSDCPRDKACINQKCKDPCPGTCGQNAECNVFNHYPSCNCIEGYSGDPFVLCTKIESKFQENQIYKDTSKQSTNKNIPNAFIYLAPPPKNPCYPSPCGPNSQCREINGQAVCSCVPGYIGAPPTCRPECIVSSECDLNKACVNQKCIDPCPGTCGLSALCQVVNHNPICTCPPQYAGDPFIRCQVVIGMYTSPLNHAKILIRYPLVNEPVVTPEPKDPCVPSPCGANSKCEVLPSGTAKCSCLPTYIGSPPNCRPECVTNNDCSRNLACINRKCSDPCPGSCGLNARCLVNNHVPNCLCLDNYVGDPFTLCTVKPG